MKTVIEFIGQGSLKWTMGVSNQITWKREVNRGKKRWWVGIHQKNKAKWSG